MYARSPTGLAAEASDFGARGDYVAKKPYQMWSVLRPETAESLFILHELTGNPVYREQGYKMFQSLAQCKTTYGYGAMPDVTIVNGQVGEGWRVRVCAHGKYISRQPPC
jgi:mannosyl-oligosaccharide alpha-1,2-mannosidase